MESNFKEVLTLFHEGQINKAKDIYLKILKKEPNNTEKEYEELTFKIASNRSLLNEIIKKLNKNRLIKPLFNTKLFTKNVESAYKKIYKRYNSNIPTENIEIK